jgi:hypothetical protein
MLKQQLPRARRPTTVGYDFIDFQVLNFGSRVSVLVARARVHFSIPLFSFAMSSFHSSRHAMLSFDQVAQKWYQLGIMMPWATQSTSVSRKRAEFD